jgi:uncharacterized protein (UPF0548 family)
MFLMRRPSDSRLAQVLAGVREARLTYPEVGATHGDAALPAGYHHVRASATLGRGGDAFDAAADGIRTWQLHRRQGFRVVPDAPAIAEGTVVVLDVPVVDVRVVSVHAVASCRITWTVDETDRFGFGYGTLPIHPASGEEAFVVERDPRTDEVQLAIVAFSRPRHLLARLGGPVTRWQQGRATQGYLRALQAHVDEVSRPGPSAS